MFHSERGKGGEWLDQPDILKTWSATVDVFLLRCRPKTFRRVLFPASASTLRWFTQYTVRIFERPPGARNEPVHKVCLRRRRETDLLSGRGAGEPRP